jgi:hypothetical protein
MKDHGSVVFAVRLGRAEHSLGNSVKLMRA